MSNTQLLFKIIFFFFFLLLDYFVKKKSGKCISHRNLINIGLMNFFKSPERKMLRKYYPVV